MAKGRYKDTRKGFTSSQFNKDFGDLISIEIYIVSIILGLIFHSWIVLGVSLVGLCVMIAIKELALVFIFLISCVWALMIGVLFNFLGGPFACLIFAIIAFGTSLFIHGRSLEYLYDIMYEDEEPMRISNWLRKFLQNIIDSREKPLKSKNEGISDESDYEILVDRPDIDNLIKKIIESRELILENETMKEDLNEYLSFKEQYDKGEYRDNIKEFQKRFVALYNLDATGISERIIDKCFSVIIFKYWDIEKVLSELYHHPDIDEREFSEIDLMVASKMLHTVDNNEPIFDLHVKNILNVNVKNIKDLGKRIHDRVEIYKELEQIYEYILDNSDIDEIIEKFRYKRGLYPTRINDVKILDIFFWILNSEKKSDFREENNK